MPKPVFKFKVSGRLSFERLFKARAFEPGQTPRYEATVLVDPSTKEGAANILEIKKAALACLINKYGSKEAIPQGLKRCYADAGKHDKAYDGYEGMFYISSSNTKDKPQVLGPRKDPSTGKLEVITETSPKVPYSGCDVKMLGSFWVSDNPSKPQWGKKLCANLHIVQFVRDNTPFGAKPADAEEEGFDALEEAEGDSPPDDFMDME